MIDRIERAIRRHPKPRFYAHHPDGTVTAHWTEEAAIEALPKLTDQPERVEGGREFIRDGMLDVGAMQARIEELLAQRTQDRAQLDWALERIEALTAALDEALEAIRETKIATAHDILYKARYPRPKEITDQPEQELYGERYLEARIEALEGTLLRMLERANQNGCELFGDDFDEARKVMDWEWHDYDE